MIELIDATQFIEKYEKGYGKKVYRIPFMLSENKEVALLMCRCQNKYISLPYLSQGVIELESKKFDKEKLPEKWEIRDSKPYGNNIYKDKIGFEYDLISDDLYTSDVRRKIRKASESIVVKYYENPSSKEIEDFYFVYTKRMHHIGVPPVSKNDIVRRIELGLSLIFIAYYSDKPVGVATLDKYTEHYFENQYFATLSKYNYLYTSYSLHSAMINYSKQKGAKIYSFGRSTKNSSVYNFKKHWRAKEVQLYWSHSSKQKSIRNNKWFFSLWKLLPYKITIILGPLIHKRIY